MKEYAEETKNTNETNNQTAQASVTSEDVLKRALAHELTTITGWIITHDHIHVNDHGRGPTIQPAQTGWPYLLNHYRGPIFVDMCSQDWVKLESGAVSPHDYVKNSHWLVGYYWGDEMLSDGYYHERSLVELGHKIVPYFAELVCEGHCRVSGYKPSSDACSTCILDKICMYNLGRPQTFNEPDQRNNFFDLIRKRFSTEFTGYEIQGFTCSKFVAENEILLIPWPRYKAYDKQRFSVTVNDFLIWKIMTGFVKDEDFNAIVYDGMKFKVKASVFSSEVYDANEITLEKCAAEVDHCERDDNDTTPGEDTDGSSTNDGNDNDENNGDTNDDTKVASKKSIISWLRKIFQVKHK